MLNTLDLNLLRIFDAMMEERSATRVGSRLGLSQSAVSHALGRLRLALGDELFLRTAQGMTPTTRAREVGPRVHAALSQLQTALQPAEFDPATTERRFVIVAGSYACAVLIPSLAEEMRRLAPFSELVVTENAPDLMEQLDSRKADFVIGGVVATPERLAQDVLVHESLAWVVRAEHPMAGRQVALEDLVAAHHVVVGRDRAAPASEGGLVMRPTWEDFGAFETELAAHGLRRKVGVTVPDTYSALAVVRRSDMATLIPRRLAMMSAQSGFLALIDPPYQSPAVDLSLLYLRERLTEPAIVWMRDLLRRISATF